MRDQTLMPPTNRKRERRGAYRIGEHSEVATRDAILDDPEVAAFAEAVGRITDPKKRACIEWLVLEMWRNQERNK